jgi:DNA-binding transcriptional LysR family regulator
VLGVLEVMNQEGKTRGLQREYEMTLDQLETFVQVARARSFSRAAILLDLAQPTLSGRIGQLEAELGVQLFVRHGHTLELSEAGRALLPFAERILGLRAEGLSMVQRIKRGGLGKLSLGANPSCSQYLMPRLIETYWHAYPGVHLDVRTALQQLARSMGRHELCRYRGYACLFDRSERTLGASGGRRSAHARSRSPL